MQTEKPTELINLLEELIVTTDKPAIGKLYIEIASEAMKIKFVENQQNHFSGLVYKNLVRLAIKAYVHENQSIESIKDIKDTIEILKSTEIFVQ